MDRLTKTFGLLGTGVLAACFFGGNGGGPDAGGGDSGGPPITPYSADSPFTYVAKVKNILVGLAPTDAEVQKVIADPTSLSGLIDGWMHDTTPIIAGGPSTSDLYKAKMLVFFQLAFQQSQISTADFAMMIPNGFGGIGNSPLMDQLVQNASESFARTAFYVASQGQDFTTLFTTNSFMLTPPLMELYAFMDTQQVDDKSKLVDNVQKYNTTLANIYVEESAGAIPIANTLDSKNASYMHWYFPGLSKLTNKNFPACNGVDPRIYGPASTGTIKIPTSHQLHYLLYGSLDNYKDPSGNNCNSFAGDGSNSVFTPADFQDWKLVTVRQPVGNEAVTRFFDAPLLRDPNTKELVVTTPRVGYFSTPAFFANWQTNTSNQMRVTLNQALIVATGMQIDGTDTTVPTSTPGLDSTHSPSSTACYSCHQTLDPTRSILSATYSWNYGNQVDPLLLAQPGLFAFQGQQKPVANIHDFATALATHPAVASAWVEKLCYWVNSQPCAKDDPLYQQIVTNFQTGGFKWENLVKDLLSSAMTTNAADTKTIDEEGQLVAIARRDHLCAALNYRLGYADVCGLNLFVVKIPNSSIPSISTGLPSDGFGRGAVAPIVPTQPSMFYRAGLENLCEVIAGQIIDPKTPIPGTKVYQSTSDALVNAAIGDFVENLMGIVPSDPRHDSAVALLRAHYDGAPTNVAGTKPTDALKSTFTAACTSPTVLGIGM